MARVTLTIECDHNELPLILQQLQNLAPLETLADAQETDEWTKDEVKEYLRWLMPEARKLLAVVATRPKGYRWDELQQQFGIDGVKMGGFMSSCGHAMKHFPGKAPLFERDYQHRVYRMAPEHAQMILEHASS